MKRSWLIFFAVVFMLPATYAQPGAICQNPEIQIAGPQQVVYQYTSQHCADMDVPDTPAMAFKDASGKVHLFNGISGSYMSVGTTLNNVHRDCSQPFNSTIAPADNNTPDSFDNWKWFRSPWTFDGKTVYGLIHNEFHGWDQPDKYCSSENQNACLYPNVTASISTDGGKTFHVQRDANGNVVLALVTPYPYVVGANKQAGIRAPTNIISGNVNGKIYYYLLASNRGSKGNLQKPGTCLYRSDDVTNPSHWRAWDGNGFNVAVNATLYRDANLDPSQHICKPVFNAAPSSWTFNTIINQYIAIVGMIGNTGEYNFGFVTSPDMINWSLPTEMMATTFTQFHQSKRGSGVAGQTYPSLIDPQSAGLNFEYSGPHPYLYFTRFNPKMKGSTWHNRDLLRVPLTISCGN